jgi:hypothetical protein
MGVPEQADMRQLILGYQASGMVEKHESRNGQPALWQRTDA